MPTQIICIRHAPTVPNKNKISADWTLSDDSQKLCEALAHKIKDYDVQVIYTSMEHKAHATGRFIGETLGKVPVQMIDDLQETERKTKQFYDSQAEFRDAVKQAMQSPDALLFGDETFKQAQQRLSVRLTSLAKEHINQTIAVVTHGRVLAMYLANMMETSPIMLWEKLDMPAFAVIDWDTQSITTIQYTIEAT